MPTITLKHKKNTLGDYQLNKGFSITIGRKPKNDVVIEDMAVSGLHAKIDSVEDRFVLVDLQSKNGTFVNEQLVSSHWLKHGDIINLGDHALAFHDFGDGPKAGNISEELEGTMFIKLCENMRYTTLNGEELEYTINQLAPIADHFERVLEYDSDIA